MNPHWLELPLPRTHFHGPKGVRAIEVYCTNGEVGKHRKQKTVNST